MTVVSADASTNGPDVLDALRASTGRRHTVLDQAMPLSVDMPSITDYRDHLLLLKAWLEPLEAWLAHFDDGPRDPATLAWIERSPLIESDLADPSMPSPEWEVEAIEWPARAHTCAYRWGVCYVIEGSQLGGAVLYRRLKESLAPHPLRYLSQDGVAPGPRWQQFIRAMRNAVTEQDAIAQACLGASDAFDHLIALVSNRNESFTRTDV